MLSILNNHSILYVEDDLKTSQEMKEYLESFFSHVYISCNGEDALTLYQKYHPDVLLLDINLPSMNGLKLAQTIRKSDSSVKIIMLTGVTDTSKLLLATELHLTKYLVKPIKPKVFKETLEKLALDLLHNPSSFVSFSEASVWHQQEEKLLIQGEDIALSIKEHHLLKLFIKYKGKCVDYSDIMLAVWEESFDKEISIDSVKNQVSQLRKKLPKGCIDSVYGKGYILR